MNVDQLKKFGFAMTAVVGMSAAGQTSAQTADDLINDTSDPSTILTYGLGYGQQRHSALDMINVDNISKLRPAWVYSLADTRGQESFPMIYDGVMYVTTHKTTMALVNVMANRSSELTSALDAWNERASVAA